MAKVSGWHSASASLVEKARDLLAAHNPMTLRQLYYQLVSGLVLENNIREYKKLSRLVVEARQRGEIPWQWIDDRLREPRTVPMWDSPAHFGESVVPQYRLNTWEVQPCYFEACVDRQR